MEVGLQWLGPAKLGKWPVESYKLKKYLRCLGNSSKVLRLEVKGQCGALETEARKVE